MAPGLINYPAFREFTAWRVAANNGVAALYSAMRLGATEATARSLREPSISLPAAYPAIPELAVLSLPLPEAAERMATADSFLATMAIPFAVAVYNEVVVDAVELLGVDGKRARRARPGSLMLGSLRSELRELNVVTPGDVESLVEFVCRIRNRIIHVGGVADASLVEAWNTLAPQAKSRWVRTAGSPDLQDGVRIRTTYKMVHGVFGVLYRGVTEINAGLGRVVDRSTWLAMGVDDWRRSVESPLPDRLASRRKVGRYLDSRYAPLGFSDLEIEAELARRPWWRADGGQLRTAVRPERQWTA